MNQVERDIMTGMISILNQAIESNCNGTPIMNDEQFDIRLADLKEFEGESNVMFVSSPNCKIDMQSIISVKETNKDNLKDCNDALEIIEYSNQKEMVAYPSVNGLNMIITYTDGILTNIQVNDMGVEKIIKSLNIPYKIKMDGVYSVKGKITFTDKPIFYVNDIIKGASDNFIDDLKNAKELNFDIVPFWSVNNFNQKKLQSTIDYVFDYIADDGLDCNGIVFKFAEKKFSNILNYIGCYLNNNSN